PLLAVDHGPMTPGEQIASAVRKWLAGQGRPAGSVAPVDLYQALLHIVEPALLDDVMKRLNGNRWVAAQWLGLNRATVRKKLALYGLHPNQANDGVDHAMGDQEA